MKKILVITYYWPPSAGVGVHRWLKFCKFLPEHGWQPVVIAPENPQFSVTDPNLESEIHPATTVVKVPIWEPFDLFNKITGKSSQGKIKQGLVLEGERQSFFQKSVIWARGNFFIPDPRKYWKGAVMKQVKELMQTHTFDAMVTTGPPHSVHLIGLALKKKHNLKWVADFRDPWSRWDMLEKLNVGPTAMSIHKKMERKVLKNADLTLSASNGQAEMFKELGAKKSIALTNGFDLADLPEIPERENPIKFRLAHIGLLNELRNPEALWTALGEMLEENLDFAADFELYLAGIVGDKVVADLQKNDKLKARTTIEGYLGHKQVFEKSAEAAVLLVVQNRSKSAPLIIPAKIFEYLTIGRPILQIGPQDCHAAEIIQRTRSGLTVMHDDAESLKSALSALYENWKNGVPQSFDTDEIKKYSRQKLTGRLVKILENL